MKKKETAIAETRPEALGAKVTLSNLDKVNAALAELAWCRAQQSQIDGELNEAYVKLKEQFASRYDLAIGKTKTTLADRVELLETLLDEWGMNHLGEHLEAPSRTLSLTNGTIAAKEQPAAIELFDGWTDDDVLIALDLETKFVDMVRKIEAKKFNELTIGDFVRFKASINRVRLLELMKSETPKLTDEQLAPFGMKLREKFDEIKIKPKAA